MDATEGSGPAGDGRCCHRHGATPDHGPTLARRRLLALGGGLAAASLAGCAGDVAGGEAPDPVAIEEGVQCDNCGMVIAMHPGPGGEIFYRENSPEGHENPARFDSLESCFFPYRLEHERLDWEIAAASAVVYVVGSAVAGAMGPDFVPFSDPGEAESFAGDHGGEVVGYGEIDEGSIGR